MNAGLKGAQLREVTLRLEDVIARESGPGRLEDVRMQLPEGHGCTIGSGLLLEVRRGGARVRRLGVNGEQLAAWKPAVCFSNVLEFRAADPVAAHERDMARATSAVDWWRRLYDHACAKLAEHGPKGSYGHPEGEPIYGDRAGGYNPWCPLAEREQYSRLLARALSARSRLADAGVVGMAQLALF